MDKYQLAMLYTQITNTLQAVNVCAEDMNNKTHGKADLLVQADLLGKQQRILKNHLQDLGVLD
jgi:hypothetical protein